MDAAHTHLSGLPLSHPLRFRSLSSASIFSHSSLPTLYFQHLCCSPLLTDPIVLVFVGPGPLALQAGSLLVSVALARQSGELLVSGPRGTSAHFPPRCIFRHRRGLFYRSELVRRGAFPMTEGGTYCREMKEKQSLMLPARYDSVCTDQLISCFAV